MNNCKILKNIIISDKRGFFCKIYNKKNLNNFHIKEIYITSSLKNCFRGFHFQIPPMAGDKIVTCSKGKILDFVIDLRKKSKFYGKIKTFKLDSISKSLFIPKGFGHGFISKTNKSEIIYITNNLYSPKHDKGIHYKSVKFEWKKINKMKISRRDIAFPGLSEFISPF